mmetsp:Transcript_28943/g.66989  ORF Transcript_28943/g.66989 Transcript_28943/m.66989 type:complete len:315 (-) Transcript_28943:2298-3242(-)
MLVEVLVVLEAVRHDGRELRVLAQVQDHDRRQVRPVLNRQGLGARRPEVHSTKIDLVGLDLDLWDLNLGGDGDADVLAAAHNHDRGAFDLALGGRPQRELQVLRPAGGDGALARRDGGQAWGDLSGEDGVDVADVLEREEAALDRASRDSAEVDGLDLGGELAFLDLADTLENNVLAADDSEPKVLLVPGLVAGHVRQLDILAAERLHGSLGRDGREGLELGTGRVEQELSAIVARVEEGDDLSHVGIIHVRGEAEVERGAVELEHHWHNLCRHVELVRVSPVDSVAHCRGDALGQLREDHNVEASCGPRRHNL